MLKSLIRFSINTAKMSGEKEDKLPSNEVYNNKTERFY